MARVVAPTRMAALLDPALDECARSLVFVDCAHERFRVPIDTADTAACIRAAAAQANNQADTDLDGDDDLRPFNFSEASTVSDLGPSMGLPHMVLQVVRASGEWAASSLPLGSPAPSGGTSTSPSAEIAARSRASAGGGPTPSSSEVAARRRARCAAHLRAMLGSMGATGLRALMAGGWRQGAVWKLPLVEGAGATRGGAALQGLGIVLPG